MAAAAVWEPSGSPLAFGPFRVDINQTAVAPMACFARLRMTVGQPLFLITQSTSKSGSQNVFATGAKAKGGSRRFQSDVTRQMWSAQVFSGHILFHRPQPDMGLVKG